LFTALSMIAELEADLARMRAQEGVAIAKAKGRLRGGVTGPLTTKNKLWRRISFQNPFYSG
jgi:DNA invertase Pin-like site-specific DNA recombinase